MHANGRKVPSILIVDDEPQVVQALTDLLEDNFRILPETSPLEALKVIQRDQQIAVVLCDQRMPRMSGDQLLMRARELSAATRLLITGHADLQAVVRAVNDGKIFGYISKPWDPDALRIMIHRAAEYHDLSTSLEHERTLMHNLMENSPDGIVFKDREFRYHRMNAAAARILGLKRPGDAVGRRPDEILPPQRAASHIEMERRIIRSGEPMLDIEERVTWPDGTTAWYSASVAPVRDARHATVSLIAIIRDISSRKEAEWALRDSKDRLRALLDSTAEAIFGVDTYGVCTFCNPACLRILGYQSEVDFLGRDMHAVLHGERERAPEGRRLRQAWRAGRNFKDDGIVLHRRDGGTFVAQLWSHPVRGNGNEALGAVVTFFDVTAQRETENQLRQAQKMEAVGQLTGGIAHDFNNILGVVIGNLDLLSEQLPVGSEAAALADAGLNAALRGSDLTKRLLAFARGQRLEPEPTDIRTSLDGIVGLLTRTLGEDIVIDRHVDGEKWMVEVDRTQLEAAIVNLAVNARDAMPGGGTLSIEVANTIIHSTHVAVPNEVLPGEYVRISVSDTGSGVPPELIERIIEPFFTTKPVGKGTGLGLSMVHGFVKQSNGYMTIASEVNHGTTVDLYLPRTTRRSGVGGPPLDQQQEPLGRGERILVVEDNDAMRAITRLQLQRLGYHTVEAASADEALDLLDAGEAVDLVFSDIIMPGTMNGLDLAERVAAKYPMIKVLLTSGFTERAVPQQTEPSSPARRTMLLNKPYRKEELNRVMRLALDSDAIEH